MINLNQPVVKNSGFHFMSYYPYICNSVGAVEIALKTIQMTSNDILVVEDKETISGYPDAMFSESLPDYVTDRFAKAINDFMSTYNFDVKIEMAINDIVGYDETLSVFIRPNSDPIVAIITQHINGQVDKTVLRGTASLNALKDFL